MVGVSVSVNLPLHHKVQKFFSGTGSSEWSRKKGRKTVVVWWCGVQCMLARHKEKSSTKVLVEHLSPDLSFAHLRLLAKTKL